MVDILTVFWIFLVFFAFLGFVRGWAREILVAASVVLAFFVIFVIERYVPVVSSFFSSSTQIVEGAEIPIQQFWFRTIMVVVLVFFGYETPSIPRIAGPRFKRDNFRDSALGFILGGFNGYLIIGTLWAFLHQAGYPYDFVTGDLSQAAAEMVTRLPPFWLFQIPHILIAVILVFFFIIAVFV